MSVLSTLFPRRNPTLPQNDTILEQTIRYKRLQESQRKYVWTDELENVVGVPMATKVPYDDKPSQSWLLLVFGVGLQLAENMLAVRLAQHRTNIKEHKKLQGKLDNIHKQMKSISTLQQDYIDRPDTDLTENVITFAKQLLSQGSVSFEGLLQTFEKLCDDLDVDLGDLNADLGADLGDPARPDERDKNSLDAFRLLFQTIPLPAIADTFMDDQSFARFRVAGPNPMLIECITSIPAKLPLTEAQYQAVMGSHDSIASALSEHRLYLIDYAELDYLAAVPGDADGLTKHVFAPVALFAVPKGHSSLVPVAIQCGQNPASNPLFFPAENTSPTFWGWQMAKFAVQVAECNYHELFVHLARTHLVLEAFTIATHRNLAESHPLNVLLQPNFFGTLFINNAAANFLISPGGPIDDFFGAPITRSQHAAGTDRLNFDFYANMLPADLKQRGIADPTYLPDFPWRDDALLLWEAIHNWVGSYVSVYYADDEAVLADTELAAWSEDLILNGKVKGFKPIVLRTQLVDVLTMIIYTATAQHAAVNFPQRPLMTYAPAITGAGWKDAPDEPSNHTEEQWLEMMPPIKNGMEQLNLLYLLGSVYYRAIGDYRSNEFPYHHWFEDDAIIKEDGPLDQFLKELKQVEDTINVRNTIRISYEFLLPSKIPNSINI
jgi:arachidonate 15-lipoxygenase